MTLENLRAAACEISQGFLAVTASDLCPTGQHLSAIFCIEGRFTHFVQPLSAGKPMLSRYASPHYVTASKQRNPKFSAESTIHTGQEKEGWEVSAAHITVREALSLEPFREARLLAGEGGLDREISSVTVMDTPDLASWLKGRELILCNLFVLRDNPSAQVALIPELDAKGAACLALKLKRFVETIPEEMIRLADDMSFPVIQMPVNVAWMDVITPLFQELLARHASALQRSVDVHRRFATTALRGGGLVTIAENLHELIGHPVTIVDTTFSVLAHVPLAGSASKSLPLREVLQGLDSSSQIRTDHGYTFPWIELGNHGSCLCCPSIAGDDHYGFLLVWLGERDCLAEYDTIALEHALIVTALEMSKRQAVEDVARRVQRNFLFDVLTGSTYSRQAALAMAESLGWDLSGSHFVVVVGATGLDDFPPGETRRKKIAGQRTRFVASTRREVMREGLAEKCIVTDLRNTVVMVVPGSLYGGSQGRKFRELIGRIRERVSCELRGVPISVGVGRKYDDILSLSRSYSEARQALSLGECVWGTNKVVHFDDLGAFRVLASVLDHTEVLAFYEETFKPLADYDRDKDGGLVTTLDNYFDCEEDVKATARKLFLHPNTVRYRLRKITELTGFSFHTTEGRLTLQMGLKIHRLLQNGPTRPV